MCVCLLWVRHSGCFFLAVVKLMLMSRSALRDIYIDDILNINHPYIEQIVGYNYPRELQLHKADSFDTNAQFLIWTSILQNLRQSDGLTFEVVSSPLLGADFLSQTL